MIEQEEKQHEDQHNRHNGRQEAQPHRFFLWRIDLDFRAGAGCQFIQILNKLITKQRPGGEGPTIDQRALHPEGETIGRHIHALNGTLLDILDQIAICDILPVLLAGSEEVNDADRHQKYQQIKCGAPEEFVHS
ncbi:protein of unknown function [Kyrpidia spormannii]|uniref:Uncharacterized protein n=1 Tax=Kyrpidia spormannii TaxID=2055160 RepID=A0ACA8Z4K8_9BACL|nr:protein of unknown function [Kyrpidia spormannii]